MNNSWLTIENIDGEVVLTKCSIEAEGEIVIPESVTEIGDSAFYGCGITSVNIPSCVTKIGNSAFDGCSDLTSVNIPNSVTEIGEWAFRGCRGLTSINVDAENPVYDSRNNCNAIIETCTNTLILGCKKTIIPENVTSIGDSAFFDCRSLTSVNIPNSVTEIGEDAFFGCRGLTSVNIPNSVTKIGNSAFRGCRGLTFVNIPNSVTEIGEDTFFGCRGLTRDKSLLFEDNVDSISRLEVGNVGSDLYLIEDGGLFKIYGEYHDKWFPVFDEEFDKVKPIKYGKYYIVLVIRHLDGKAFILCPLDLLKIRDIHNRITLESCMSADDFLITTDDTSDAYYLSDNDFPLIDENEGISIFKIESNQYFYIFPFAIRRVIMVDVDATGYLRKADGRCYELPTLLSFFTYGCRFVYILRNGKGCVYTIDGHRIGGEYNFWGVWPDDVKYAIIEKDGKSNVFSFEKMNGYFDEWFEDCDLPDTVNGEWIFKVKDQGECKILDDTGNDISDKYRDVLEQWIEDSKKGIGSQNR